MDKRMVIYSGLIEEYGSKKWRFERHIIRKRQWHAAWKPLEVFLTVSYSSWGKLELWHFAAIHLGCSIVVLPMWATCLHFCFTTINQVSYSCLSREFFAEHKNNFCDTFLYGRFPWQFPSRIRDCEFIRVFAWEKGMLMNLQFSCMVLIVFPQSDINLSTVCCNAEQKQ